MIPVCRLAAGLAAPGAPAVRQSPRLQDAPCGTRLSSSGKNSLTRAMKEGVTMSSWGQKFTPFWGLRGHSSRNQKLSLFGEDAVTASSQLSVACQDLEPSVIDEG